MVRRIAQRVLVDGKEFRSITEAANHMNISHTRLARYLRHANSFLLMRYHIEAVTKKLEHELIKRKPHNYARGERHCCAKLDHEKVKQMRLKHAQGVTYAQLARDYGVSTTVATNAIKGRTWK